MRRKEDFNCGEQGGWWQLGCREIEQTSVTAGVIGGKYFVKVGGQRSDWEDSNSQAHMISRFTTLTACVCSCALANESVAKKR